MLSLKWQQCFLVLGSILAVTAAAQTPVRLLVTQPIDESKLVTLPGSVHPLAQSNADRGTDRGAVSDSFPTGRLLLLLNRPAEREAALDQFLHDAHTRGTASYHQWLTPEQFGAQFGAADSDVQLATSWLIAHGFSVAKTSKGRQFIEFSGTAGAVRAAFHTEIHRYEVKGETHHANASEVKIPAALTALIRGVSPMNDFRVKPQVEINGPALYSPSTKKTKPQWTMPNSNGSGNFYAVAPADFATQYDLGPLYKAGINGAGQTIGIINESNIDLSLVQAYQNLFGISGTTPQVVIDGDDPGESNDATVEAYLDVEVSGSVAPKATLDLYVASGNNLDDPLSFAAVRAVEDNQASVLSVSFGGCETSLGAAGNQFWAGLWQQAAAQGQTVLVSAGDSGSECFFLTPDSVNGLASTPWNVAVGGTDFYYSDYATGGASAAADWNQTNDGSLASLKAPLTEQVWNNPFGLDVDANGLGESQLSAGGGGQSNCSMTPLAAGGCGGGYAKPSWQTGSGVPADKMRDLPDVSLFAANGFNLSAYPICALEGECVTGSGDNAEVYLVGGTSASAPAMAGIIALVNQKYGRQGQANFVLYPLAQQMPAAFHDITVGSNRALCWIWPIDGCVEEPSRNGVWVTTQFFATPGYDLASGLGTVDASVLVNSWNSITFQPTTTTLHLSSTTVAHGTPLAITATVAPESGAGTPTGDVAIEAGVTLLVGQSQLFIPLTNGTGTSNVNSLPVGEYEVTGRYGGDGTFASSTSPPVLLTVTAAPQPSNINFSGAGSVQYNAPLIFNIQPTAVTTAAGSSSVIATGTATFTVDSLHATVALNSAGIASWMPPALSVGAHTASATYSGDVNLDPSSSAVVAFSVTKGFPYLTTNIVAPLSSTGYSVNPGGSVTIDLMLAPGLYSAPSPQGAAAPTGTVTMCLGTQISQGYACQTPTYSQTVNVSSPTGLYSQYSSASATFPNLAAGVYEASLIYNGDGNWVSQQAVEWQELITVAPIAPMAASTTTLSITPNTILGGQTAVLTATVAGSKTVGVAPTGLIYITNNGSYFAEYSMNGSSGVTGTLTLRVSSSDFWNNGSNQLTATYFGDDSYAPSTSNTVNVTATQAVGDFSLAAQASQVTVQTGSSATDGVNLGSINGFSGTVALSCTPSSSLVTCSFSPATVSLNGQATAMVTINAAAQTAGLALPKRGGSTQWPLGAGVLAFGLFLAGGRANRKFRRSMLVSLGLIALGLVAACSVGCGVFFNGGKTTGNPSPAATYSVVVTGTSNGIVHNATITVVEP
jgi:hypothetical protein